MNTFNINIDEQDQLVLPIHPRAVRRKHYFLKRHQHYRHQYRFWKPEKRFKLLAQRPIKMKRAQQLGFEYPRISSQQRRLNAAYEFWISSD